MEISTPNGVVDKPSAINKQLTKQRYFNFTKQWLFSSAAAATKLI